MTGARICAIHREFGPFGRSSVSLSRLGDGAGTTDPVTEPGYPEPESFAVRRCLGAVLSEEWEHRLYAERDLDVLESRPR